jgi:hypothetical protein
MGSKMEEVDGFSSVPLFDPIPSGFAAPDPTAPATPSSQMNVDVSAPDTVPESPNLHAKRKVLASAFSSESSLSSVESTEGDETKKIPVPVPVRSMRSGRQVSTATPSPRQRRRTMTSARPPTGDVDPGDKSPGGRTGARKKAPRRS